MLHHSVSKLQREFSTWHARCRSCFQSAAPPAIWRVVKDNHSGDPFDLPELSARFELLPEFAKARVREQMPLADYLDWLHPDLHLCVCVSLFTRLPVDGVGSNRRRTTRAHTFSAASRGLFLEDDIPKGSVIDASDVCATDPGERLLMATVFGDPGPLHEYSLTK